MVISQADQANMQFTAPSTAAELQFELLVTDSLGASGSDSVDITVLAPAPTPTPTQSPSGGGGGCVVAEGGRDSSLLLLLLLVSLSSLRRHSRLRATNTGGAGVH